MYDMNTYRITLDNTIYIPAKNEWTAKTECDEIITKFKILLAKDYPDALLTSFIINVNKEKSGGD